MTWCSGVRQFGRAGALRLDGFRVVKDRVDDGFYPAQIDVHRGGVEMSSFRWTTDGKDISVLAVDIDRLQPQFNVAYFPDDVVAADRTKLKELTVSAGDGIFVLGFPMGLTGNTPRL